MDGEAIVKAVTEVTKKWFKQRKAEERDGSRKRHRRTALVRGCRVTQKEAAWERMEPAYLHASSSGTLPAHARQIMYAARGPIQEATGEPLDDKYFTQTLLPDYMNEHPERTSAWDVVFDARGHFLEPHTGVEVPLGTLEVRQYLGRGRRDAPVRARGLFPTRGAGDRFQGVLFIEKEGFLPLFHRVQLAERYDLAIMSTKGMSVVAARVLADELCGRHKIPLLVLRDFDKSGFSILGTLTRNNRRYKYHNKLEAVDLGLRLDDVLACGLQPEDVSLSDGENARANLRRNGATDEEVRFLCSGKRVELNAFASAPLVGWVEGQLKKHGIRKVVPGDDLLAEAYRRAFVRHRVRAAIPELVKRARRELCDSEALEGLRGLVEAEIAAHPAMPWDVAVVRVVEQGRRPI
jgi:hypothetical protein